jgi:hypothetical protein
VPLPWLYGDAMNIPATTSPRQNSCLTDLQITMLFQWVAGNFINDYVPELEKIHAIEELPITEQPAVLDQASLDFCVADAFHPGCEITWPMRHTKMYMAPFRIKHAMKGSVEPDYGTEIGSDIVNIPTGPILGGQFPGGLTRWMAIPWQTDTASCRSGYDKLYDPYVPTFWPARVPNEVLLEQDYNDVMNESLPMGERLQAFAKRADWLAPLGLDQGYTHQINTMIQHFDHMSVVESRPGPKDDPNFPSVMEIAEDPHKVFVTLASPAMKKIAIESLGRMATKPKSIHVDPELTQIDKVRRFPATNI